MAFIIVFFCQIKYLHLLKIIIIIIVFIIIVIIIVIIWLRI